MNVINGFSFRSFQRNKEKNSLYNQNIYNSSHSQHSSSGYGLNSIKNFSLNSAGKFTSVGLGENPDTVIVNNTINNRTLNLFITSNAPNSGSYTDIFTQNELDWNYINRELILDNKSVQSDQTPSFSSLNFNAADSRQESLRGVFKNFVFQKGMPKNLKETNKNAGSNSITNSHRKNSSLHANFNSSVNKPDVGLVTKKYNKATRKASSCLKLNTIKEELKNSQNENKTFEI